jgi:protein-S-isoprenylcysteine O-methyltransferase Ste14
MKQTSDGLFQHPGLRSFLVKARKPLFILVLLLVAPFARADWLLAGFVVSMIGEFIQLWCFASLDKNSTLTIRGPYTMVRNPMYLGRFLIPFGFLMLLGPWWWWLLLIYTVVYWKYMDARVEREEAHLQPIFGAPYDDYRAKVRRFLPGWPLAGKPVAYWNWALFAQNNAGRNLAGTLLAWVAVAAWTLWGTTALSG